MRTLAAGLLFLLAHALSADPAKWREDLRFLQTELPRVHKNAFHAMTREQFDAAVADLDARIPQLADHEIAVEIAKIVARVGDGHTFINFGQPELGFHMLPVRFYRFQDGIFLLDGKEKGAKVLRIGDFSAEEAWSRVEAVTPRDNEMSLRDRAALHLAIPEILHALRISPTRDRVRLKTDRGEVQLEAGPFVRPPQPPNFTFDYLEEAKALHVQFNAVNWMLGDKGATSPGQFFDQVFAFAEKHPVEKLIIDVRHNGGGNNGLLLPIVHGLIKRDALNQRDKLFVLIGRETFSAAQNFVNLMEKHTNATFAGEPTGGSPNHYGDPRPITLPNSRIVVRASTLWWQDVHPADTRTATRPQLTLDVSSADYFAGRDPVLDAVLRYRPVSRVVADALPKGTAAEEYKKFKADPLHVNLDTERELNDLGYSLLRDKHVAEAVLVMRLNAESYPQSANAHDSLGEVLLASGAREEAIREYEKALELDPRTPYRTEVLARVKATRPSAP